MDKAWSVGRTLQKARQNQSYFSRDESNGQTSLATPATKTSKNSKVTPNV